MKTIDPYYNYKQLIIKFLSGNANISEEAELQAWISADPENAELFSTYRLAWLSTSHKVSNTVYNKEQVWQNINNRIDAGFKETENNGNRFVKKHVIIHYIKVAAFIVFVFLLGGISSLLVFRNSVAVSEKICVVTTPLGSRARLILPDKSQVWLNAGSTLSYPESFDRKNRHVKLQGEAFFKVKSNKSKPFVVSTGLVDIKALGTSFNVKAYPSDNYITATLVEGTINVNGTVDKKKFAYTLKPNQNLTIPVVSKTVPLTGVNQPKEPGQISLIKPRVASASETKTRAYVSWKDQRWIIQGEPLNTLVVMLERRYDIKIHLASGLLHDYKFTGIIQNETFEQVLQYLRYTTPVRYEIGKGEVWLDIDPDLAKKYTKILDKKEP